MIIKIFIFYLEVEISVFISSAIQKLDKQVGIENVRTSSKIRFIEISLSFLPQLLHTYTIHKNRRVCGYIVYPPILKCYQRKT